MIDEKLRFDYKGVRDDFHNLLVATGNKLEREWPNRYKNAAADSAQMILLQLVRLAVTTYKTIGFLCSDVEDGAVRDPHFALSTPPLNRTILEIIVSTMYLLEDVPGHTSVFYRAAWREEEEMLRNYQERYAGRPRWDEYITQRTKTHQKMERALKITTEEKENLERILRWPRVGQVIKRLTKIDPDSATLAYIHFLNDWLYRELSSQSHLEPRGLGELGLHFLGMDDLKAVSGGEDRDAIRERLDEKLLEFKTKSVWIAITLILSLVSEIELHFEYDLRQRAVYLWNVFTAHSEIVSEIFEERYKRTLADIN
jgi:hypothetical protein